MFNPVRNSRKFINTSHMGDYAKVGDFKIHYIEKGQGETILLIHGIGQSLYTWRKNIDELSRKFRVIAVDLLGFGCSDRPDIDYTPEEMAEFLRAFLESIGVSRVHVAAFSTGAIYALAFAEKYPIMADRLILVAPGMLPEKASSLWMSMLLSSSFSRMALSMMNRTRVEDFLYSSFFDKTVLNDEVVDQYYTHLETKEQRAPMYMALNSVSDPEVLENLRSLKNQTLIMLGKDDPWRSEEETEVVAGAIPNSYFVCSRNCGHMMHEEKPEKFNATVIEFLEWNLREPRKDL